MKRALKIIVITLAIGFATAQLYRPNRTTAAIVPAETLEATTEVPENVAQVLQRSCNDCHTNQTNYPWYANITPVNWLLAGHIEEGRQKLNFSVWNTYDAKKKARKFDQICDQVIGGEMPHFQYLWMHRDAKLSDDDKKLLCSWSEAEKAKINENR